MCTELRSGGKRPVTWPHTRCGTNTATGQLCGEQRDVLLGAAEGSALLAHVHDRTEGELPSRRRRAPGAARWSDARQHSAVADHQRWILRSPHPGLARQCETASSLRWTPTAQPGLDHLRWGSSVETGTGPSPPPHPTGPAHARTRAPSPAPTAAGSPAPRDARRRRAPPWRPAPGGHGGREGPDSGPARTPRRGRVDRPPAEGR